MRLLKIALLSVLMLCLVACGGGGSNEQFTYVDADFGDDSNDGTSSRRFKTITKALVLAVDGDQILVLNGIYDEVNGEDFPLKIPKGVGLISYDEEYEENRGGDCHDLVPDDIEALYGDKVLISNSSTVAEVTIEMEAKSQLVGFCVDNEMTMNAVEINGAEVVVESNQISALLAYGINANTPALGAGDGHYIYNNIISNSGTGMIIKGADAIIEANEVTSNQVYGIAVVVDDGSGTPDLGGGDDLVGGSLTDSNGGNLIYGMYFAADLFIDDSAVTDPGVGVGVVFARDNCWDHAPPEGDYLEYIVYLADPTPPFIIIPDPGNDIDVATTIVDVDTTKYLVDTTGATMGCAPAP
jgi:hypothetical protein